MFRWIYSSMSLPDSTSDRIKKVLFKILDLPEEAIHYADIHIDHFLHDISIKIKTVYDEEKKDVEDFIKREKDNIHNLKEEIFNNDRFQNDAIHENSNTHEFVFSVPEDVKPELKEIAKIQNAEDGVVNKEASVNQLLDKIESKV